jgi:L-alanine-DL-glutamate epimerase-like enolase superfamily enzyme
VGYTYTDQSAVALITQKLADAVTGLDAGETGAAWDTLVRAVRNIGRPGLASAALSAIDVALWDLKARLLELPLAALLPRFRDAVPVYGSGGFTSYSLPTLERQLAGWVAEGMTQVKIKVGRNPQEDHIRVRAARAAIGDNELFVDANGAWSRKQALEWAEWLSSTGCDGWKSPSVPTTSTDCACCVTAPPQGWMSPQVSTGTTSATSAGCSMPVPWTACKLM